MEMGFKRAGRRRAATALVVASLAAVLLALLGAGAVQAGEDDGNVYTVHNLVSDVTGEADHFDSHLKNGWGLTRLAGSPWWVANNHTNTSTLYMGDGTPLSLVVNVAGGPTGAVGNATSSFVVGSGPARFLFANEDGQILGWNSGLGNTAAVVATTPGAIYKGLTLASTSGGNFLYAADFHNAKIDVFNGSFAPVSTPGAFTDPSIPAGFGPFNVQLVDNRIFVTYARQDEDAEDEVAGVNQGFVDVYDTSGRLLGQVGTRAHLNAPWGVTRAPDSGFGRFSGDLLVGNFGDGRIVAYKPHGSCGFGLGPPWAVTGAVHPCFTSQGVLRGADHLQISIDGLWGIGFGAGNTASGPANTLFFTAGPDDEEHGLFGTVNAVP